MKTWNDIIRGFIDECYRSKVYTCDVCSRMGVTGSIQIVIDHIEEYHNEIYLEYKEELARVDNRIKP